MVAAVHAYRDLADGELLERFVKGSDESAFTVLIERYGASVLGVCRRALGNLHDAEDVCQATFLVLARKASSIRKGTSIASWLHGVACRVAGRFKRDRARRQCRERETEARAPKDAGSEVSWREAQTILDEELERLPERYRAPLILCYLDGKTRDEAARRLRLSTGSLHGRLERGRDLLRERLTRRGLTLSSVLFATALGETATAAALPAACVISWTKAAMALAGGQAVTEGVIPASVLTLTHEVLKSMFLAKLKLGTAAVICASLIATATCGTLTSMGVAQDVRLEAAKSLVTLAPKPESDETFIRRISLDLRGTEPTPTEIHFFVASKDAGKRDKLVDLMIQERQAKKHADKDGALWEQVAQLMAQGYRAIGIRVKPQDIASGLDSLPMSRVDILLTLRGTNDKDSATLVLVENVLVLAADANLGGSDNKTAVVTVALKPDDCHKVDLARTKGTISMALSRIVDCEGTLLPIQRLQLYAPLAGQIVDIPLGLKSGSTVYKDQELLRMNDQQLAKEIYQLKTEIANAESVLSHGNRGKQKDGQDQAAAKEISEAKLTFDIKSKALKTLLERTDSLATPGYFKVKSPMNGIVLSSDFREALLNRYVKPNEVLLRVGAADMKNPKVSEWEVELKIPQKHMVQMLRAFANKGPQEELDVDLLLTSYPTRTFKGKLLKSKIALQANADRGANNEPVVLAWVRISGRGIPAENQITVELLLAGTEVRARIRSRSGEK
jgi:RNA polymerase sigma factor (sigma-70 family)